MPSLVKLFYFRKISSMSLTILKNNRVIEPELLYIVSLITQGKAVIDIGANMGEYLYVLERSGKFSSIIGIEPNLKLAKRLKKLFTKCSIFNVGISNTNEIMKLKVPIIHGKITESRGTFETFADLGETDQIYIEVPVLSLDNLVREKVIQNIEFIKIDVEDHELNVVQASSFVIKRDRPIILIEIEQRHHKEPIVTIFNQVVDYGYQGYVFNLERLSFIDLQSFSTVDHQQTSFIKTQKYLNNFLFVPSESHLNLTELNDLVLKL